VVSFHSNTTSILQPITLGVIANFEPVIYSRLRHIVVSGYEDKSKLTVHGRWKRQNTKIRFLGLRPSQ